MRSKLIATSMLILSAVILGGSGRRLVPPRLDVGNLDYWIGQDSGDVIAAYDIAGNDSRDWTRSGIRIKGWSTRYALDSLRVRRDRSLTFEWLRGGEVHSTHHQVHFLLDARGKVIRVKREDYYVALCGNR